MGEPSPAWSQVWPGESPRTDAGVSGTDPTIPLHRVRRLCLGVLTLVLLVALSSVWWPMASSEASGQGAGGAQVQLRVEHEHHLRPGTDSTVTLTLTRASAGDALLVVGRDLFTTAGVTDVRPTPTAQGHDSGGLVLRFDDAPALLTVTLEGRVPTRQPPGRPRWRVAAASGHDADALGHPDVSVTTRPWVLP